MIVCRTRDVYAVFKPLQRVMRATQAADKTRICVCLRAAHNDVTGKKRSE